MAQRYLGRLKESKNYSTNQFQQFKQVVNIKMPSPGQQKMENSKSIKELCCQRYDLTSSQFQLLAMCEPGKLRLSYYTQRSSIRTQRQNMLVSIHFDVVTICEITQALKYSPLMGHSQLHQNFEQMGKGEQPHCFLYPEERIGNSISKSMMRWRRSLPLNSINRIFGSPQIASLSYNVRMNIQIPNFLSKICTLYSSKSETRCECASSLLSISITT